MRVLWVCSFLPGPLAEALGEEGSVKEGWVSGLLKAGVPGVELSIAFGIAPGAEMISGTVKLCSGISEMEPETMKVPETAVTPETQEIIEITSAVKNKKTIETSVDYYSYHLDMSHLEVPVQGLRAEAGMIIERARPDLVHIFGMEYPQGLDFAAAFGRRNHTLVSIQGVMGECAAHYLDGIPENVRHYRTFRDIVRRDSMADQQSKFYKRAELERSLLGMVGHAAGRTDFDREYIENFGENGPIYHVLGESLRNSFYRHAPDRTKMRPHSIFVSQGNYPLKGLHMLLQAMPEIVSRYPDAVLTVGGDRITASGTWKEKLKLSGYGKYLLELVEKTGIEKHVIFKGEMTEEQVCAELGASQVMVNPSAVENSSNSIGEAMMLGVPVVASRVGGTPSILCEDSEGLLYDFYDLDEMTDKITRVFENTDMACSMSEKGRLRAQRNHSLPENRDTLLKIYGEILEEGK